MSMMMMMMMMMPLFQYVENLLGQEGTETELTLHKSNTEKYCSHTEKYRTRQMLKNTAQSANVVLYQGSTRYCVC